MLNVAFEVLGRMAHMGETGFDLHSRDCFTFSLRNGLQGVRKEGRHPSYRLQTQYCPHLQKKLGKI